MQGCCAKLLHFDRPSQRFVASVECRSMRLFEIVALKPSAKAGATTSLETNIRGNLDQRWGNYVFDFSVTGQKLEFQSWVVDLFCIQAMLRGVERTNGDIAEFQCNLATSVSDSYRVANNYASGTVFDTSRIGYLVS